ncbi:uncharacterized protein LOC124160604 isoform X2 [Ischnura elegans]|uniref:uncharacterized protein LOC124160604 isoform X2 n=1 Tax=Ischnura elegans TaxID=197161 RepID=UPI001ED871AF|nr:uncharacterized protein LOC124160604 isoform X2 [Ischnura elegans]
MNCFRGNRGFCCYCLRCGKKRGLTEEEAVTEEMEQTEPVEDKVEEDIPKMEGYLEKKGKSRLVSSWRRYWFVLEGRRLTYYESQPHPSVELPPSCKGSLTIAPATSVTTSKQAPANGANHQPNYREIFILNSSRLVTLRTKDADQFSSWVKALVASTKLPVKSQPANGSNTPQSAGTTSLFPLQPSTKYFRYSLTNLSTQEEIKPTWPKNGAHTMDARSCSLYQRKSGSLDDMLDNCNVSAKESVKEAVSSDSDDEDNDDLQSKTASPKVEDNLSLQNPTDCSIPMIEHELPQARLCDSNEKDLVQKKELLEEMSSPAIKNWDKIHPSPYVDENYEAEHDLSRYIELTGNRSVKHSDTHDGKVKARRFLTSLVPKDSKIFEGICKQDRGPKKERQSMVLDKKGGSAELPGEKNEKSKAKNKHVPPQSGVAERQNDTQRVQKVMSVNEASHAGSSVRNSLMKRTSEFRTARRGKRNKDKKKSETDEADLTDVSPQPLFSRQNSRKEKAITVAPLLDESDAKKKRKRMGFLTKMLRGKKSDGQEEVAERYDMLEDIPFDSHSGNSYKFGVAHANEISEDELSPRVNSAPVPHHLSFGLKLFPMDDDELKRKLELRMAQIESGMASARDLPEPALFQKSDGWSALLAEDSETMNESRKSFEETVGSPPPALPPRMIKLTPPTPPVNTDQQGEGRFDAKFQPGNTSNDSYQSNRGSGTHDEIILCGPDGSEWKSSSQNSSELNCYGSAVSMSGSTSHHKSDSFMGKDTNGAESKSGVFRSSLNTSDVEVNGVYGVRNGNGVSVSPRLSWENQREQYGASSTPISSIEPLLRSGNQVDELSLLLSELDRINSSPLPQDSYGTNHRPASEEVKPAAVFEVDYITAFPIRRRRNSDPDYDIPRPHRIPHIQATKEEPIVEIPPPTVKQPDRRSAGRENTDSIVIEATRFFGPGMDFSFNEKKYSDMKNSEDMWDYPYHCRNQELNFASSDYFYGGECERLRDSASSNDYIPQNIVESTKDNLLPLDGNDSVLTGNESNSVVGPEDCLLRPKMRLEASDNEDSDKVILRSSGVDRACRKERSREIYEADLADQFKLNDLLEGLSITSQLEIASESKAAGNDECSGESTTTDLDPSTNVCDTLGSQNQESQDEEIQYCHTSEIPEMNYQHTKIPDETESEKNEDSDTQGHSMSLSAKDEGTEREKTIDDQGGEVVLRSKQEGSSREDSRNYRLSFATTETLLVEEEVLVATLKTTTTTTTFLPSEDGSTQESRENVEEFVEEIVLDMDQLSGDQFDSMQVHSCVQT